MLQSERGQIPEVDLRMLQGCGYIRGISGIDDRGETFGKAALHLSRLAESRGEFSWTIDLDIEFGPTTSLRRLLDLVDTLDKIARNRELRGSITLNWTIPASDTSLKSTADSAKAEIDRRGKGGLKLQIKLR